MTAPPEYRLARSSVLVTAFIIQLISFSVSDPAGSGSGTPGSDLERQLEALRADVQALRTE
jgi:hypothetical protein